MSIGPPTTYTTTIYPWGQPQDVQSNDWVLWDSDASNPITLSFASGLPVKTVWIPQLTGPVTFYAGDTATGTPFYVSGGAGSEVVPILVDTIDVTLVGSGGDMYVYYTSLVLDPFRQGVIGNQVTAVTGIAPITSTGGTTPAIGLTTPLAITYGGTGTASPVGVESGMGSGIIVTGSFPDQTLTLDTTGLGVVTAVTASAPLASTGGTTPNISIATPIPLTLGGTNQPAPGVINGPGISVTGTIFDPATWTISNIGVTSLTTDDSSTDTGDLNLHGVGGIVTATSTATIRIDGSALVETVTSPDGSVNVTRTDQTVKLSVVGTGAIAKLSSITGSNPSGSLTIPTLPAGNWIIEAYAAGLDATEGDASQTSTITLSSGPVGGMDGAQYTRYVAVADQVSSAGSLTVSATLVSSGGVGVNMHASAVFFVFKATPVP